MKHKIKRFIDIFLASIAILISSPVMIIISLLIFLFLGRPIFFTQLRPGYKGELFKLIKFRSMRDKNNTESDQLRLTKFGSLLRSSSLDELPELFNVLKGEMSLVGPRPLLEEYLEF